MKLTLVLLGSDTRPTRIMNLPRMVVVIAAAWLVLSIAAIILALTLSAENRRLSGTQATLRGELSSGSEDREGAFGLRLKKLQDEFTAREMSLRGEMNARENILREEIASREELLRAKEEEISAQKQRVDKLDEQLGTVRGRLDTIREMDTKIRQYLGLEIEDSDSSDAGRTPSSHQGGMDPHVFSPPDYQRRDLTASWNPVDIRDPETLIRYADGVSSQVRQTLDHLNQRKKKHDRVPSIMPVKGDRPWLSSQFGWRKDPFTGLREFHNGLDIAGAVKEPIIAPAEGKVVDAAADRYLGKFVKIDHGDGVQTLYGHLHGFTVKKGQKVKRGQVIGYLGNTGRSTGPHLHYSVLKDDRYVDPMEYIWDYTIKDFNFVKYDTR